MVASCLNSAWSQQERIAVKEPAAREELVLVADYTCRRMPVDHGFGLLFEHELPQERGRVDSTG